jgi:phenylacetate-CoA ligase
MAARLPELNEWRDWDALRSLQQDRLGEVLAHARRTPFYRDRLPAAWDDVPLTTKADLRASYPFGLLAVAREQIATYHETTGTTGDATASLFTEHDWQDVASRCVRNGVELAASDWLLIKSPYALVNAAPQIERAARMRGTAVIAADSLSANMPYDRVLHLLHSLPITVVWCWATELLLWAAAARRADRALPGLASLRAFLVMGEVLSEPKRAHIEKVWGTRVFQDFGSVETGSLAGECREHALHLWADRVLFEVYDPVTRTFAREGRGQLVVTPLFREAMALVRYHLGDVCEISYAPCACGWRLPTIRIWGRPTTLAVVGGREVFPVDIEDVVFRLPHDYAVWFWRARPRGGDELEIEIATHEAAACDELRALVHDQLGIAAEVRAVSQDALVPPALFETARALQKPQFMFAAGEPWGPIVRH